LQQRWVSFSWRILSYLKKTKTISKL
jgi:hypothetical protein